LNQADQGFCGERLSRSLHPSSLSPPIYRVAIGYITVLGW
jgi:hypothetical protein